MYPQKIKKIWWNEKVTISLLKFFERLKILIVVFPIQRMSTIQNGIGKQHPLPRPRKTTIKQLRMERDGYSITINNIE
jgi:hypothetical protein